MTPLCAVMNGIHTPKRCEVTYGFPDAASSSECDYVLRSRAVRTHAVRVAAGCLSTETPAIEHLRDDAAATPGIP